MCRYDELKAEQERRRHRDSIMDVVVVVGLFAIAVSALVRLWLY